MSIIPSSAKMVFHGITFDVYQWEQEMFDGSKKIFEKLKRNHSIDIVATSKEGEIYILEESQPLRDPFLGLVWWTCEPNEEPLETARRELLEETGLISDEWYLFWSYQNSSRIDHKSHIFIARNCKKIAEQNLDSWENIKIKKVSWVDFLNTVASKDFRTHEFSLEALRYIFFWQESELKQKIFW